MKLPNGEEVKTEQINEKLVTYILAENHKDGKHKARLFRSKLGITLENKEVLIEALIQVAQDQNFSATENSKYGQKYVINFELVTAQGSSKIRSAWIVRNNENYPRLTTVYPID